MQTSCVCVHSEPLLLFPNCQVSFLSLCLSALHSLKPALLSQLSQFTSFTASLLSLSLSHKHQKPQFYLGADIYTQTRSLSSCPSFKGALQPLSTVLAGFMSCASTLTPLQCAAARCNEGGGWSTYWLDLVVSFINKYEAAQIPACMSNSFSGLCSLTARVAQTL